MLSNALRSIPGAECLPPDHLLESARLIRAVDVDTIEVHLGEQWRSVLYIRVNIPERRQAFHEEATAVNQRLIERRPLRLIRDVSETDRHGRLLRYVFAGEIFVNRALVLEG